MKTLSPNQKDNHSSTPYFSNQKVEIYNNTRNTTIKYKRSEKIITIPRIYWNTICKESGRNPKYIAKESWENTVKEIEDGALENFTSLPDHMQQFFSCNEINPEHLDEINDYLQKQVKKEHESWHTFYHGGELSRIQTLLFSGLEKNETLKKQFYLSPFSGESRLYGPYTAQLLTQKKEHAVDKTFGTLML